MTAHDYMIDIVNAVAAWDSISVNPHRFGGREFKLGNIEIGHVHRGGMVDIPFPVRLREILVREGKTNRGDAVQRSRDSAGWRGISQSGLSDSQFTTRKNRQRLPDRRY